MLRTFLFLGTVSLLALNGVLHGLWTQRWAGLTEAEVQAACDRLHEIPLKLSNWDGHRIETDTETLPEEMVGQGVSIRYVHRVSGTVVGLYLSCGRTAVIEGHTPLVCYPAHGYKTVMRETRVAVPAEQGADTPQFWAATFSQGESPVPVHLRVFWSWKGAGRWQVPDNPGRVFRASPFLYKCYVIRQLSTPDEPLDGDPSVDLLKELLPRLDEALANDR